MPPNKMLHQIDVRSGISKNSCVGDRHDDVRNSNVLLLSNCNCRRYKKRSGDVMLQNNTTVTKTLLAVHSFKVIAEQ